MIKRLDARRNSLFERNDQSQGALNGCIGDEKSIFIVAGVSWLHPFA